MENFAFCTITYGDKYTNYGDTLIKDVTSRGGHIFVLTNNSDYYSNHNIDNLTVLNYEKNYFSFHEKKTIVRECLKYFDTAVFLDADVKILNLDNFNFLQNIDSGLHIFNVFGNIKDTFLNDDINPCRFEGSRNTKYGNRGLKFLNEKKLKYEKNYHGPSYPDGPLEHFLEGKWILKKDNGKENDFLNIWDDLAAFSEKIDIELGFQNTIGAGEGAHMSIAAYNSNIKTNMRIHPLTEIINKNFVSNYEQKKSGEKPWNIAG